MVAIFKMNTECNFISCNNLKHIKSFTSKGGSKYCGLFLSFYRVLALRGSKFRLVIFSGLRARIGPFIVAKKYFSFEEYCVAATVV